MAYFKEYYNKLGELKKQVSSDIKNLEEDTKDQLIASMLNFKKEVSQLMQIAANNSAIEGKASQVIGETSDSSTPSDSSEPEP